MATKTFGLLAINDDAGSISVTYDYDDVSLLMLTLHVINTDARAWTVSATADATAKNYTSTIQPGTNLNFTIPAGVSNRLPFTLNSNGKLIGVTWSVF